MDDKEDRLEPGNDEAVNQSGQLDSRSDVVSASPVDGATHTTTEDSNNVDVVNDYNSPPKRQKVHDKDGFVMPATPDIPVSSIQYTGKMFSKTSTDNDEEVIAIPISHDDRIPTAEETSDSLVQKPGQYVPFENVIKNQIKEGGELLLQFIHDLSGMEQFEFFSVTRLQSLLDEAKVLESSLLQQREQLRQRVQQLSQIMSQATECRI